MNLDNLLFALVFSLLFSGLFQVLALNILIGLHVGIENHPLSSLDSEGASLWWVSLDALLTKGQVKGLRSSLLVKELVAK